MTAVPDPSAPHDAAQATAEEPSDHGPTQRPPARLAVALFLGVVMWIGPFIGFNAVLLPARLDIIAPDQKVALVATLAVVGSIVALVANIFFGALSDLTRSRFGRRIPWIVVGSVGTFLSATFVITTESVAVMVAGWCGFQFFLNAIVAPLVTVIPDRVPTKLRGSYSAVYGVAMMVGASLGQLAASGFVADPQQGMWILAVTVLLCAPVVAILAPDTSNTHVPRPRFSKAMVLQNFTFPLKGSRDFYFALSGKLLFVLGTFSVTGYQLYILTDYMGASSQVAGSTIAAMSIINLVTGLVFGAISGPISDKLGRRKILVMGSAVLVALGTTFPFFVAQPWAMIVFALIAGVGQGVYNSVDQALNYEVLPDPETAAKDLGILNMSNTGGQIMGPALTSAVVGLSGGYGGVFIAAAAVLVASAGLIKPIRKAR